MSRPIIAALRRQTQLKGNTLLVATELAHRLNPSGYGRVSYQFLAWKAHCCRRTAITQVQNLLAEGLFRKTVIRTREGYAWNLYQYCGPRHKTAFPPVTTHGASVARTLPEDIKERGKEISLRQDIENLKKGLRLYGTPGSEPWIATQEKIAQLEALLEE